MDTTIATFFTRIGLICDFLAFFLAAPEILGENGMRKAQRYLRILMISLSFILFFFSLLGGLSLLFFWLFVPILMTITSVMALSYLLKNIISTNDIIVIYLFFGCSGAFLSWIPAKLMKTVEWLSNNRQFRRQLLNFGIFLFIIGSIAQLIGTF